MDKYKKHEGWVFTQTLICDDPHDGAPHCQDFDVDIEKIIEKVKMLDGVISTFVSGEKTPERLAVYYNLPGEYKYPRGTPDINISIINGKLSSYGLGPCCGVHNNCDLTMGCTPDCHGVRWLALRGIAAVIEEGGPAEPFLRYLDSLWTK